MDGGEILKKKKHNYVLMKNFAFASATLWERRSKIHMNNSIKHKRMSDYPMRLDAYMIAEILRISYSKALDTIRTAGFEYHHTGQKYIVSNKVFADFYKFE